MIRATSRHRASSAQPTGISTRVCSRRPQRMRRALTVLLRRVLLRPEIPIGDVLDHTLHVGIRTAPRVCLREPTCPGRPVEELVGEPRPLLEENGGPHRALQRGCPRSGRQRQTFTRTAHMHAGHKSTCLKGPLWPISLASPYQAGSSSTGSHELYFFGAPARVEKSNSFCPVIHV